MTTLIFDLDGTLIDTSPLVIQAYQETFRRFPHLPVPDETMMRSTFGHPDVEIWRMLMPNGTDDERQNAYDLSSDAIQKALFGTNVLLPHALPVLMELRERGHTLTVASNCGIQYLNAVLDSQGLRTLMMRPLCLESVNGTVKADILSEHFRYFQAPDSVMIGDRRTDMDAAAAHGVRTVGCNLGASFGHNHELANADIIIESLTELLTLFPEVTDSRIRELHRD